MTDVETVARALCKADGHNPDGWAEGRDGVWIQRDWRAYRKLARAALAAATPLIEARVREECAAIAETLYIPISPKTPHTRGADAGEIAAAIRKARP